MTCGVERVLRRTHVALAALGLALACCAPGRALAHPLVEDGERHLDAARFSDALSLFDRAAQGDELDASDVVRVLEGRALAHRALGDERAMDADLMRLAALRPEHTFATRAPPEVEHRFSMLRERGQARMRARVDVARDHGVVRLELVLDHDPGGLVRSAVLYARAGDGAWVERSAGAAIDLEVRPGERIEYHARVIGLGGAVLIEHGTRDAPLPALVVEAPIIAGGVQVVPVPGDVDPWPWVLGSAALVAVAGVVITVTLVATQAPGDTTRLSPPRVLEMP